MATSDRDRRRVHAADWAGVTALLAVSLCLVRSTLYDPLALGPVRGWTGLCFVFAVAAVLIHLVRGTGWSPWTFDYVLGFYLLCILATWPTAFDRGVTRQAVITLLSQVAFFYGARFLFRTHAAGGRVVVAVLIAGIAVLEWMALDYHVRYGIVVRLAEYLRPADWNGREGIAVIGAIQLGLLLGVLQRARSWTEAVAAAVLLVAIVVELVFLYARLAWIAAAATVAAGALGAMRTGRAWRYAAMVGVLVAAVGVFGNEYIWHLGKVALGLKEGGEGTPAVRLILWRNAVGIIRDHPLAGIGYGNYQWVHQRLHPIPFPDIPSATNPAHPHNVFLQQAAELGVIGGGAYAVLWGVALWTGWRALGRPSGTRAGVCAFYGLVAVLVSNLGENMFLETAAPERVRVHTMAWLLLALVVAERDRERGDEREAAGGR